MADPRALLQKADKLASSASGGFSFFGGKTDKLEQAVEAYSQAANAFRIQNQGAEAGAAFEKSAAISKRLNEEGDAANSLTEAFKAYKKTNPEDAARCLDQAIAHYAVSGNLRRAATHKQNLAELYEVDIGDNQRAIKTYEEAGDWFSNDNAEALANKVYLKVADLSATEGDYAKSTQKYEAVARQSVNNNLMRWSVKEYFLKAGICHLASKDLVATKRALESYIDLDPSFQQQREYQLLMDLTAAVESEDEEMFEEKLFAYDQMSKLDKWKTTLLLRVKKEIEGGDLT